MTYVSQPIVIGPSLVPGALWVANTKQDIVGAIGRKGLLGHRGQSLVAVAAADLARTHIFAGDAGAAAACGIVALAPQASRDAVREVNALAVEGRYRSVSILDAPNVSPNVVSAASSLRLGAQGPAFTVDTRTDGLRGAWRLTTVMLAAGRCPSVFLVEIIEDPTLDGPLPAAVAAVVSAAVSPATPYAGPDDLADVAADFRSGTASMLAALWPTADAAAALGGVGS
jgi:hypothetical protein